MVQWRVETGEWRHTLRQLRLVTKGINVSAVWGGGISEKNSLHWQWGEGRMLCVLRMCQAEALIGRSVDRAGISMPPGRLREATG